MLKILFDSSVLIENNIKNIAKTIYLTDKDYFKINELDLAEGNIIKAIEMNPNHSSSHLMLANINNQKGNSDC